MSKQTILANVRSGLAKRRGSDRPLTAQECAPLQARLEDHVANLIPEIGKAEQSAAIDKFLEKLDVLKATTERLDSEADVPAAVTRFLKDNNQPNSVLVGPGNRLKDLGWDNHPLLEVREGLPETREPTSITHVLSAIAETGTLMIASGETVPPSILFLPENHIAIVHESQIVGNLEAAWEVFREAQTDNGHAGAMPRSVNLISGPSRTGDIGATMFMGAHGPKRLHVLVIRD